MLTKAGGLNWHGLVGKHLRQSVEQRSRQLRYLMRTPTAPMLERGEGGRGPGVQRGHAAARQIRLQRPRCRSPRQQAQQEHAQQIACLRGGPALGRGDIKV